MNRRLLAITLLIPFSVLSAYAVFKVGYIGILDYHRHSPAGWQVFADLVIACLLCLLWLIPEAKQNGRNPWPFCCYHFVARFIQPLILSNYR